MAERITKYKSVSGKVFDTMDEAEQEDRKADVENFLENHMSRSTSPAILADTLFELAEKQDNGFHDFVQTLLQARNYRKP